jgi:hypothetical protein
MYYTKKNKPVEASYIYIYIYIYITINFFYKKIVFRPKTKISKYEAHSFYKMASWMLLMVTHYCSCYPMEQSSQWTSHAYGMALEMPRDLVDRHIWDACSQTLQILLDCFIIFRIPSCYYHCFPSPLDRGCTRGSEWPYICMVKIF